MMTNFHLLPHLKLKCIYKKEWLMKMKLELILSRITAFTLQIYNSVFSEIPLRNAPYGECNTGPDALSWLPQDSIAQNCLDHDGMTRCWYVYTPLSVKERQSQNHTFEFPLLVHLHGAGGCASLPSMGWGSLAEEFEFVVVWPQGTYNPSPFDVPDFIDIDDLSSWNDGSGLFGAEVAGIDDLGFLQSLIEEELSNNLVNLDQSRVYMSGHSNGAVMAQRFSLQTNGVIAAVAAISGAGMPGDPEWLPGGSVGDMYSSTPIILVAGTIDNQVPFGERRGPLAGAIPSFEKWASINGCDKNSKIETTNDLEYIQHKYKNCANNAEVQLLEVFDAGHHPFTKGKGIFQISPLDVIAECPFRGIPFFYEADCGLANFDSIKFVWDFISSFEVP